MLLNFILLMQSDKIDTFLRLKKKLKKTTCHRINGTQNIKYSQVIDEVDCQRINATWN